jgi:hypothetical protein
MKVRATRRGYYTNLREVGDTFTLMRATDFSTKWMEKVAAGEESPAEPQTAPGPVKPRRGRPPKARPVTEE